MKLTDASKAVYSTTSYPPTYQEIQIGAIQRIADACELMARRYQDLINERDNYRQWMLNARAERDALDRSNRSLRGVITRIKRRAS